MTTTLPAVATITVQKINRRQRVEILSMHFGRLHLIAESMIYTQLRQLSDDYQRGHWEFYQLSNGGFYMMPDEAEAPEKLTLYHVKHCFKGQMSAEAAGIVASLLVFKQLYYQTWDAHLAQLKQCLQDYAVSHPEAELIFNVARK